MGLEKMSQERVAGDFVPVGSVHVHVGERETDSGEKAPLIIK